MRLKEIYLKAKQQVETTPPEEILDPMRPIREAGFPSDLPPRDNLYIVLKRFFQAGFHNRKLRDNPAALRRAGEILRALQYWSGIYSPPLFSVIEGYLKQNPGFMSTTRLLRDYAFGRRLFLQGTDSFFLYQATGRETSRSLSREKLSLSAVIMEKTAGADHAIIPFGRWFLTEMEKDPLMLEGL